MRGAKLVPLVSLKIERLSINRIAEQVISLYKKLSSVDTAYSQLNIVSEKKSLHQSIDISAYNAEIQLAEEILHQNIEEIRKMDKVENPNLDFVMDESIISIGLETKINEETLMTLNFNFQYSNNFKSKISNIVTNQVCFDVFEKAKIFLEIVKESFSVDYSVIKIADRDINKVGRGYRAPLGWITYFSNDYEIPIPDDLEGIEYEYVNDGKYLILTRENPITLEVLDAYKFKLMNLMEEIKRRVPDYGK